MHHHSQTKYYFIDKFDRKNINKIDDHTALIFRNYINKNNDQTHLLMIKKYCKQKGIKFYLSNNVKLAIKLDLDGAYIPSFNKNFDHLNFSLKKKFTIIGSAHNIKEIKLKETQKVQKIFLSSLFKKNKNYLGINRFKLLKSLTRKEIVALGGISKKNIKKLKLANCPSFAGISFFK
ncbi:thiamine phosphate synthase [Candidatus Pelagibacter sp.]|nr:thiamine phosphate synthase [Candidatus Pelagibacter sp.]